MRKTLDGNIQVALPTGVTGTITVLNSSGQMVAIAPLQDAGAPVNFQLERQSPGLYWITLTDTEGKIIVSSRFALIR